MLDIRCSFFQGYWFYGKFYIQLVFDRVSLFKLNQRIKLVL